VAGHRDGPEDGLQLLAAPRAHGDLAAVGSQHHTRGTGTTALDTTPIDGAAWPGIPVAFECDLAVAAVTDSPGDAAHGGGEEQEGGTHIRVLTGMPVRGGIVVGFPEFVDMCAHTRAKRGSLDSVLVPRAGHAAGEES
jgi:hypothetical protein